MAIPTAVPTKLTYKGVDYLPADPITITELTPIIDVTFDVADTTGYDVKVFNNPAYSSGYFFQNIRTEETQVTALTYRMKLDVREVTTKLEVKGYNTDGAGSSAVWDLTVSLSAGTTESWQYLASTIFRDTLLANLDAASITKITQDSVIKIFWEEANEKWVKPFILLQHITGGDLNSGTKAYAEMLWQVTAHALSIKDAGDLENAIHKALARKPPVINFTDVCGAGYIEEATPVTDRYQVQNVPVFASGAIYRIRLSKG